MFPKYPYLDLSDRNLDFLTKAIREMENEVKNFVTLNAVKYANPIQWSINRQYEKNTIVIDPLTGTAFISVQPVPSGVSLTRTQYWTPVFDLSQFVTKAASNFANSYERDITTTATMPTGAGDWVVWDSTLYMALTSIHAGDAYVVNGNIKRMTVEDFYDLLMQALHNLDEELDTEIRNRTDADDALGGRIDDEIQDRQDADDALEGRIDDEIQDRQDADTALGGRIDDEIQDRQDADTALGDRIDGLLSNIDNLEISKNASLMTYNSTPVDNVTRLSIVDGNNSSPSMSNNNPSVMINRVDDSYSGDTTKNSPNYILYDLYATMKRIATSCGYASTILGYMEDNTVNGESAGGSTQSVAVSGMSYVTGNSSIWALYGDTYNYSRGNANVQACELNVHNHSGVDYTYNPANPVAYPFSCGIWNVTGGENDNSFAYGVGSFDVTKSHWRVGEYYQPFSVTEIGIDMQATPTVNIKLHGAKTDPLSGINHQGIGIEFAGNYWQDPTTPEVGHGAIHLHNEAICFGSSGLGHIYYDEVMGQLQFWYNGSCRGYINMGGANHEL